MLSTTGTLWKLLIKNSIDSAEVYNNLSTIDLPSTSSKAVQYFHLPTESQHVLCRPLILNTSSIYIKIECQNKWHDCPLQYRIETACTWDVRIDQSEAFDSSELTFNVTINSTLDRIQIRSPAQDSHGNYPNYVYAIYHKPIYYDRNDSWLFTVKSLNVRGEARTYYEKPFKIVFGFITDRFPMNYTRENGWNTFSHDLSTAVFRTKQHTGYYCIDEKTRKWNETLAGDDGHYSAILGIAHVVKNDQIRIDIGKLTDVNTNKTETIINVFKNNETTIFKDRPLPEPIPKELYPGKTNLIIYSE
ncbi:unnamed protein product [Rotaria sp. Silwood2]|nr:unnamed protein product [Rotaria sp. Silwood2]CAF4396322.1 unnamed protein product [Rotaria sp. Silwood2]